MFAGSKQDLDLRCRQTLMTNAYFFNLILIKLTYKLMRRFTLFLALCLMCIGGTALAQVITAVGNPIAPNEISPSKKYVIYAQGQGFLNVNGDYNKADKTSPVAFVGAAKNPYIYTFEATTNGWKIKDTNGKLLPGYTGASKGPFRNGGDTAGDFIIAAVADGTNSENTLNNGSNMVTIKHSAEGGLYVVWNSGNGCLGVNAYNGGTAPNNNTTPPTSAVWGNTSLPFQICEATTSEYSAAAITELSPCITSTEDLKVGYKYLIRNVGNPDRRGYVYEENGALKVTLGDAFYNATPADKLSDACIFTVTGNGTEGFAFVGKSGNTYKAGSKLQAKPGKEAGVWNVKTTGQYLNVNPGEVTEWYDEGDANGVWEFYPINVSENLVSITYNIKLDGRTIGSSTVQNAIVGFGYPNLLLAQPSLAETSSSYYTYADRPTSPITAGNTTIDLTYTDNLPFPTSNSYENAHWCYLTIDQGKYMLTDNGNASYISLNSTKLNVNNYDANLWCFVGNAFEGFKIYNKAAGPNKVLSSSTNTSDGNKGGNTYPVLTSTSELNGKNECWALTEGNIATGFYLSQRGYPKNKMNRRDNKLAYWNAGADNGSTFFVTAESADVARTIMGTPPTLSVGVNVGQVSQEMANSHTQAAYEALTTGQAVANFFAEINAARIMPEGSKYYRIINKERKTDGKLDMLSITVKDDGIHSKGQASTNANVDMLWKFVVCEDGYKIKRANADQYLGVLEQYGDQSLIDNYQNGAKFTIEPLEDGYVRLKDGNGSVMHDDGSHQLCAWSDGDASVWQIVPATDIEVALNTVDGASYATVYLPFAVQVPGDGVTKLYTGEIAGNQLNMTAQNGVVPAEKGYVLCNTSAAASTTLTISSETGSISGTNDLQGTLTGITFGESVLRSSYLVLGQGNTSHTIGFYTPSESLAAIGKNKAYLNANSVDTQANAIALNFDDVTTGISLTEVNGENAPVYDLSGRRVQRTVKGGLYIQNGKKYIVK